MYQDLKRLVKHSSIYTMGNFIYRGAGFLLIPLYLHYLKPSEYGMLEVFYATISVTQSLLASGITHAALRFYFEYADERDRKKVISTAMLTTFLVSSVGTTLFVFSSDLFSSLLFGTVEYTHYFQIVFFMLVFEISKEISLAFIRAREQSLYFICVAMLQLFTMVGLNVYLLAVLGKGVYGILLGNLISTIMTWALLTGFTIKHCGLRFEWSKLRAIVGYGYPLMFSGFISTLSKNADRYFLNLFTSLEIVGLYALASKLGVALQTFVVEPFTRGYGPFRFSVMQTPTARTIYSRVMTYFLIGVTFIGLTMAIFSEEIIRLVSNQAYYGSSVLVPWFLLDVILFGILYNLQTGIYVTKKTQPMFYITLFASLFKLLANAFLIPRFGPYGAIGAVLIASLYGVIATWRISQKLFFVEYEYGRILKVFVLAGAILVVAKLIPEENLYLLFSLKLTLALVYPLLLMIGNFLHPDEKDQIRTVRIQVYLKCAPKHFKKLSG